MKRKGMNEITVLQWFQGCKIRQPVVSKSCSVSCPETFWSVWISFVATRETIHPGFSPSSRSIFRSPPRLARRFSEKFVTPRAAPRWHCAFHVSTVFALRASSYSSRPSPLLHAKERHLPPSSKRALDLVASFLPSSERLTHCIYRGQFLPGETPIPRG